MKIYLQKRRIAALLMTMILLLSTFTGFALAESFTAEVKVSKMTVRSGPDASYQVVATLSKGKQVTVLSYSDGIAYISFDGLTGYARVSDMKKVKTDTAPKSQSGTCTITVSSAKIYKSASTSAKVIYKAKRGQTFTVLSTDGTWAKLQNGSYVGYTLLSNIDISANVTATPTAPSATATPTVAPVPTPTGIATIKNNKTKIYKDSSTNSKVMTTVNSGASFTILSMDDTWVKLENGKYVGYALKSGVSIQPGVTATPAVTASPTPKVTPTPVSVDTKKPIGSGRVNVNTLYIYTAPDASSSKLTSLSKGRTVTLYSNSKGWALIQYGTYVGYVKSEGLNMSEHVPETATPTPAHEGTVEENMSVAAFANCSSPIYRSQSTSSTKLKTVSIGTELTVLGHNNSWALVKYGSTKGYMQVSALTKVSAATMTPNMNAKATITASKAEFYKYASSSSKQVGSLSKGTEVVILACDSTWALVQYKGNTAYCTLSSMSEVKNPTIEQSENVSCIVTEKCAIYQYASTSSAKAESSIGADTAVTMLGHNNNWALISYKGRNGYVQTEKIKKLSEVSLTADESYTATVTSAGTVSKYMYEGSSSAGKVSKGMQVNVLGHTATWALIEKNGNKGYYPISKLQIQLDEFASPQIKTVAATVIRSATVYSKAQESSSKAGSLSQGTDVTITAYTNKWARISYGSGVGYVLKSYVSNVGYGTLKSGSSSSSDILKLQKTLEDLGYFDGIPAGNYGTLTENAVSRFQSQIGMTSTGIADQSTLRVLYGGYAPQSSIKNASLSKGAIGTNVTRLQTRLTYKGYLSAGIDGEYGALTQSAVTLYQKVAGINQTGNADSGTLSSLFSSSAPKNTGSAISGTTGGGTGGGSGGTGKYSTDPGDDPSPGTASSKIETVISYGLKQLGKPYIYGTSGPNSFDCSGLTTACYRQIGVSLGRSAYAQGYGKGTKIESVGELKRGDIVCMNTLTDSDLSDHVGIYLGGGKFVHASSAAGKVIISSITSGYYNRVFSWGRRVV